MRTSLPGFFFLAASAVLPLIAADPADAEAAQVRVPLELYLKGHATGNGEFFRQAFHPDAWMRGMRNGEFVNMTIEEYIKRAPGKPAADEERRKRRIDFVQVSGNTAIARVTLDNPDVLVTDFMSLVKFSGGWKIVHKTFYAEPKAKN